jgi:hypothetical protein
MRLGNEFARSQRHFVQNLMAQKTTRSSLPFAQTVPASRLFAFDPGVAPAAHHRIGRTLPSIGDTG